MRTISENMLVLLIVIALCIAFMAIFFTCARRTLDKIDAEMSPETRITLMEIGG